MFARAIKFCAVGAFVCAVDFVALWLFKHFLPRFAAVSLAYFVAVGVHFGLSKWWVFDSRAALQAAECARYVVMVLGCWLCTVAIVWLALKVVTNNVFIAKAFAIPPTTLLSFVLMRRFVFR